MTRADLIIVGQGIAGTVLAHELLGRGRQVIVIGQPALSACSRVAGGIYNPVVFKRLTKSWLADTLLPVMHTFYADLEKKLQVRLLYPVKIAHPLSSADEEALWKRKATNELAGFVDPATQPLSVMPGSVQPYGIVKAAGFVDVQALLSASRSYFAQRGIYREEAFAYGEVKVGEEDVRYKDLSAQKIIFCEGYLYKNNPWFAQLSFKPAKGEILTIKCDQLKLCTIFTKDFFILPLAEPGLFKVGATYGWEELNDLPGTAGREELVEKFSRTVPYEFEIIKHEAGVRPATVDRRPVLGFHHAHRNLGIFNGLGTKGVMLAPWFAKHFCSFMLDNTDLWHEVDVKRFAAGPDR